MDQEAVKVYHDLWDDIRVDDKVHPFYHRLERFLRDERAGGLGLDKKMLSGLLEYGVQRMCNLPGRILESMTVDVDVLEKRETMVREAFEALRPILDETLQLDECDHDVETCAVASWKTALFGDLLSSKICITEFIVGEGNWEDTVEHIIFPDAKTMDEVYGKLALEYPPYVIDKARRIMRKWLRYAASQSRKKPLFMIVDRNRHSGYPNSRDLLEQEIEDHGFTQLAEVCTGRSSCTEFRSPSLVPIIMRRARGGAVVGPGAAP